MKIGLVGEAPSDTSAVRNLLLKKYPPAGYEFITMLDRIMGSVLDNQKTKRLLRKEYEITKPEIVIFIRDLDGTLANNTTMLKRKDFFRDFNSVVDKTGVLLLNIFEIEALLIADITTFNNYFKCALVFDKDPMEVEMPKDELKKLCKAYDVSLNAELFAKLDFDTVSRNCRYFEGFIQRFEKKIAAL